jgi:hypothetical protein
MPCLGSLRRQRCGSRSQEIAGELGEDGQVGLLSAYGEVMTRLTGLVYGIAVVLATVSTVGAAISLASTDSARTDRSTGFHARCPHTDQHPGTIHGEAAKTMLVPPGTNGVLLCRYHGFNPNPDQLGTLAKSRPITRRATVERLARQFNALQPPPAGPGVTACPFDDGSKVLAFFLYRKSRDVPVSVGLGGCRRVSNGQLGRTALGDTGTNLLRRIKRLTRDKHPLG